MLCFIMALKSAKVANDWPQVCKVFERTLCSVFRQSHSAFRVIVACHEIPSLSATCYDNRLTFVPVTFAPPAERSGAACMHDKWAKLHVGITKAGQLSPQFVMLMDADDCLSKKLVSFVLSRPDENGWDFDSGYLYVPGSRVIALRRSGFSKLCGTSSIVNARHIDFTPCSFEESRSRCVVLRAGHVKIAEEMRGNSTPLSRLPFPGSVYIRCHGDNDSHLGMFQRRWPGWRETLRRLPETRICTRRIRDEFGL
jgi:hypothetical protein